MQKIKFCFTSEKAKELYNGKPPQFETPLASGFDLRAVGVENKYDMFGVENKYDMFGVIHNCEKDYDDDKMPAIIGWKLFASRRTLVKTGIRIELPIVENQLMELQIRSRSGLALKHGLRVFQGIGTIDNDYRGELGVIFQNAGREPFEVNIGDRIAQGVFNPLKQFDFQEVSQEEFEATCCDTKRGSGGFGSTGK